LVNTNFLSHIALIKALLPQLQRSKGHIVNVSSEAGLVGAGCRTTYSASKFAISGFARSLRSEVKHLGIRVTNVYPGYIQTGVSKNALIGKGDQRLGKTDLNIKNGMPVNVCCE
jgi:NAD(P)-dependent dehydrogenase (short-subunit alcohol dehydrogenase family)